MKIGFLFPGYSEQYVGMAKELYDESRIMQEYFDEASTCLPINFIKLCFASSDNELAKIEHAYPSIFLTSVSIAHILYEKNIHPAVVAGFSLGELSAIAFADGISFPDGLYLLSKYAELYKEALENWYMKAVLVNNIDTTTLTQVCDQLSNQQSFAHIAIYLTSKMHVVTGHERVIDELMTHVIDHEGTAMPYPIEMGLHSSLMDPIVMYLKKYMEKIDFRDAKIPVACSANGKIYTEKDSIEHYFIEQINAPVYWNKVLKQYSDMDIIVHVGPGKSMADFVAEIYPTKKIVAINKPSDIQELQEFIDSYKTDK